MKVRKIATRVLDGYQETCHYGFYTGGLKKRV